MTNAEMLCCFVACCSDVQNVQHSKAVGVLLSAKICKHVASKTNASLGYFSGSPVVIFKIVTARKN